MKELKIKNLYIGKPDAKDEVDFDSYDKFASCFVMPPNFDSDQLLYGDKCFIRGYKGTGKTALLYYLENLIKEQDSSSIVSFLYFKDFDTSDKCKFENIASKINKVYGVDVSIAQDVAIQTDGYVYVWKWLLLEQLINDNIRANENLFVQNEHFTHLKKLMNLIQYERLTKRRLAIPSEFTLCCSTEFAPYSTLLKPEIKLKLTTKENFKAFEMFKRIIDEAMEALAACTRTDIPYYLMIDELEAYYAEENVFKRDLLLIRDLIITVKEFNKIYKYFKNTKIVCSLRTEILNSIYRFIPSREINKITNGFECPLIWNYSNSTSYKHPIFQILLKRIQFSEFEVNGEALNDKEIFKKWFAPVINNIPVTEFFLNQTWSKPRDVIRFLTAAQHCLHSNSSQFNQAVFISAMEEFSSESLKEIREELNAIYNSDEIDEILYWLNGWQTIFTQEELEHRLELNFKTSVLKNDLIQVLSNLYRIGLIGCKSKSTGEFLWQHRGNDMPAFSNEWLFYVHRGLFKSLAINTKSNYRKFLLKNEKNVEPDKIYEVTVVKAVPGFLIVKLNLDNKQFKGSIHVSEIEDGVVDIDNFKDYYPAGTILNAKTLFYDNKHKSWQMSLKF